MTTEAPGKTSTWTADPMHSIAEFAVKHLVVTTVKGRFRELEATLNIDEAKPENSSVEAKIAVASIDTNVEARDADLRSDNFFSAQQWRHDGGRTARRGGDGLPAVWPSHVSRNADEAACAGSSHGEEGGMNSATHIHLKRNPTPLVRSSNRRQIEVTNTPENNKAT